MSTSDSTKRLPPAFDDVRARLATDKSGDEPNALEELARSAAYTAIQSPVNGVVQLCDKLVGTKLLPKVQLIDRPADATIHSLNWYAQQTGSALGMMPWMIALHSRFGGAASRVATAGTLTVRQGIALELRTSALTGLTYGGFLTPTDGREKDLFQHLGARIANAGSSAATFATLTGTNQWLRSNGLKNELVAGLISGAPAGAVAAHTHSFLSGEGFAKGSDLWGSVYSFSVIGGIFGAGSLRLGKAHKGLTDKGDHPINPIPEAATSEVKIKVLMDLSHDNAPIARKWLHRIDKQFGSHSTISHKTREAIISKVDRRSVHDNQDWFDVEHVHDAFRFRTVLNDLKDLPALVTMLKESQFTVIDPEPELLTRPTTRGWRMASFILRAPNGQLVEYQVIPREVYDLSLNEHNEYKSYRDINVETAAPEELEARRKAYANARKGYFAAWDKYLDRTGQTNHDVEAIVRSAKGTLKERSSVWF